MEKQSGLRGLGAGHGVDWGHHAVEKGRELVPGSCGEVESGGAVGRGQFPIGAPIVAWSRFLPVTLPLNRGWIAEFVECSCP